MGIALNQKRVGLEQILGEKNLYCLSDEALEQIAQRSCRSVQDLVGWGFEQPKLMKRGLELDNL